MEMSKRIELIIHYQLQKHFIPIVAYLAIELEDITQDIQVELARLSNVKPFDEERGSIETYVYNATRSTLKNLRDKKNALKRKGQTVALEEGHLDYYHDPDQTEDTLISIIDDFYSRP